MSNDGDGETQYKLFTKDDDGEPRKKGSQQYSGLGKAHYKNGDGYDGAYVEGYRKGKGIYTWRKWGDSYEGQWGGQGVEKEGHMDNRKHGFGKMVYRSNKGEGDEDDGGDDEGEKKPRGGSYLGWYHNGKRGCAPNQDPKETEQSQGTFTYANGDIYVGQWRGSQTEPPRRGGKKHGRGTYSYAKDGSKLVGDWEQGKIQVGKWVFPNGTFYSGQFRYNKPFGEGVWVFANGNQLTGKYVQKDQGGDDAGGEEEDAENAGKERPDPKVWCSFKYGESRIVRGGSMCPPPRADETAETNIVQAVFGMPPSE